MIQRRHSTNFKRGQTNYFRLTALEDNTTFTLHIGYDLTVTHINYIDYSINEGRSWTRVTNKNKTSYDISIPNIRLGDSVLFRGIGTRTSTSTTNSSSFKTQFNANKKFKVSGVLMTLLKGKWANQNTSIGNSDCTFTSLFAGDTNLIDAEGLILPPDTFNNCFRVMFYNCSNLETAPILPASILTTNCYYQMFYNCPKITTIKMYALNVSASNCLYQWLGNNDIRTTLEFYRNPEATWLVTGKHGIPLECTLFDDTEESAEEVTFIDPEVQRLVVKDFGNRIPRYFKDYFNNADSGCGCWNGRIRIGGVNGKILRRQIVKITTIWETFRENTLIQDMSDFNQFENVTVIGKNSTNGINYYSRFVYGCTSLTKISLPPRLKYLCAGYNYNQGAFMNTKIQSVDLPDTLEAASDQLFRGCTELKTVRWGAKLPAFHLNTSNYFAGAFYGCSSLETITNLSKNPDITAECFKNCNKFDVTCLNFHSIQILRNMGLNGGTNWPSEIIFSSLTNINENYSLVFNQNGSCAVDKIYLPKVTNLGGASSIESQARLLDFGNVTAGQFRPYHHTNIVNADHYDTTFVLRSKAVPSLTNIRNTYLKRLYVYPSIIDDFKTTYSTLASKTLPIGGETWVTEYGSSYEYADYPTSQAFSVDDSQDYYHEYTDYNSSLTMTAHFSGTSWRTIIFPTDRISGSNIEIAEITGVTITEVDDELDSFTLTTSLVTGDVITPGKPYLIRATDGESTKTLSANPAPVFESIALPSITIQDADSKYQFIIKGTYEAKDDLVDSYVWNGSAWILNSEISPMRAYITVTKLEQE